MKKVSEALKKAIDAAGYSDRKLGMLTGVHRQSIGRFMAGEQGLGLEQVDRLAAFLGLELRPAAKKERK